MKAADPRTAEVLLERIESLPAQHRLVVISGPTATGKTALAGNPARSCRGEIVSADSRQQYRGMEIATATATPAEQQEIPHHLLSFLEPDQVFSLPQYQRAAFAEIDHILARGNTPFLVGGTGLYVNAITLNYAIPDVPPDDSFREGLLQRLRNEGFEKLRAEVAEQDSQKAESLLPGQERRLIRTLEVLRLGPWPSNDQKNERYQCLFIFLTCNRSILRERVRQRIQRDLSRGLLKEIQTLLKRGYNEQTHALDSIGCKEWIPYLQGRCTLEESTTLVIRNTMRYAKRQETWFAGLRRRIPNQHWVLLDVE